MANLLFDTPWWLLALLAGAGIVLFWNGNRRREDKLRNIGLALIAGAILLGTISYLVDTDLEKCIKQSKALAYDVEKQNWPGMKAILDPYATVGVINSYQVYTNRDAIIEGAKAAVDRFGVKNVRILNTEAEQTGTIITVRMTALSDHDNVGVGTINTGWELEWKKNGEQWSVVRITNLKIGNTSGDAAGAQVPRPR